MNRKPIGLTVPYRKVERDMNHPLTNAQQAMLKEAVANKPNETMAQTIAKLEAVIETLKKQSPEKFR